MNTIENNIIAYNMFNTISYGPKCKITMLQAVYTYILTTESFFQARNHEDLKILMIEKINEFHYLYPGEGKFVPENIPEQRVKDLRGYCHIPTFGQVKNDPLILMNSLATLNIWIEAFNLEVKRMKQKHQNFKDYPYIPILEFQVEQAVPEVQEDIPFAGEAVQNDGLDYIYYPNDDSSSILKFDSLSFDEMYHNCQFQIEDGGSPFYNTDVFNGGNNNSYDFY